MDRKKKHKDKYDENVRDEGMKPVDNNSSEESGMGSGEKKKPRSGEGIEEFIDDKANLRNGEKDDT